MTIQEREQEFKNSIHRLIQFPADVQSEFFDYWSEPNKSGTKMRFELEKTWDLSRRLKRWLLMRENRKDFNQAPKQAVHPSNKIAEPTSEVERLDAFLNRYRMHPTGIKFDEFGKWFDYMISEGFLAINKAQAEDLLDIYKGDKYKCRCASVQIALDTFANNRITFSEIFKIRK